MTLKQIMKEIMSPDRAQSEESLWGLNLGMFGMLYNLYSKITTSHGDTQVVAFTSKSTGEQTKKSCESKRD